MIRVYMSGICGSGMLPLALVASKSGYEISGSDKVLLQNYKNYSKIFRRNYIQAWGEPHLEILELCNYYVYSSAIPENHIERKKAIQLEKENRITILHRMDFLNLLISTTEVQFAVAGTHGKTSSTSMLGWLLLNMCLNPTIIVGGKPKYLMEPSHKGGGFISVFETDESDGSFLKTNANYKLILNIDKDHLNYYGNFENLINSFYKFSINSFSSINHDDENLKSFAKKHPYEFIGFGSNLQDSEIYKYFFLGRLSKDILYVDVFENQNLILSSEKEGIHFKFPGIHFLYNGLGVISIAFLFFMNYPELAFRSFGVPVNTVQGLKSLIRVLNKFMGVERRIDYLGQINHIDIYDDYGHHPEEIRKVLESLKLRYDGKIGIVFQPHRYTRTKELAKEFAEVLAIADVIYLLPIYSAGEEEIPGVSSELIGKYIKRNLIYLDNQDFDEIFYSKSKKIECCVFMGAGNISNQIRSYLNSRKKLMTQ